MFGTMEEELEAEFWAKYDYVREAYGPSAVHEYDDPPDESYDVGPASWQAADAVGKVLYGLVQIWYDRANLALPLDQRDPDWLPF